MVAAPLRRDPKARTAHRITRVAAVEAAATRVAAEEATEVVAVAGVVPAVPVAVRASDTFRAAVSAHSAWIKWRILIIKIYRACVSTSPSAPKSSHAARPVRALATWLFCPI